MQKLQTQNQVAKWPNGKSSFKKNEWMASADGIVKEYHRSWSVVTFAQRNTTPSNLANTVRWNGGGGWAFAGPMRPVHTAVYNSFTWFFGMWGVLWGNPDTISWWDALQILLAAPILMWQRPPLLPFLCMSLHILGWRLIDRAIAGRNSGVGSLHEFEIEEGWCGRLLSTSPHAQDN